VLRVLRYYRGDESRVLQEGNGGNAALFVLLSSRDTRTYQTYELWLFERHFLGKALSGKRRKVRKRPARRALENEALETNKKKTVSYWFWTAHRKG